MKGSHVYVVTVTKDSLGCDLTPFSKTAFESFDEAYAYVRALLEKGFTAYVTTLEVK